MIDLLDRGTRDHYLDAALYDHEYRRRRDDVLFYRDLAERVAEQHGAKLDILELGCGTGRLAVPLVRDGHRVWGVDLNETMLRGCQRRAGRLARARRQDLKLLLADMQLLALGRRFDLVFAAFNTLQHVYTARQMLHLLRRVHAHLTPDGLFVFDVLLPDLEWLCRDSERRWARQRFRHPESGELWVYSTNHDYDAISQVAHIRLYYDDPEEKRPTQVVHLAHRQFFPQELLLLLEQSGFRLRASYGDFKRGPLHSYCESQVYVAHP
jgi:SAM-dependent methyltransferase